MNMPFEMGIEYGYRLFSPSEASEKRCLILEKKRHTYAKALSDLAGVDIQSHNNKPVELIRAVRHWFVGTAGLREDDVDSPKRIYYRFVAFEADFYKEKKAKGFSDKDLKTMPVTELISNMKKWAKEQSKTDEPPS